MLNQAEFIKAYSAVGGAKAADRAGRLFALAVLAGFLIGMAGAATNTLAFGFTSLSAVKLICGLLFPFGLIMVILSGAELFTGNCLMLISLLEGRAGWKGLLRNLLIVYLGNFAGALLAAAACVYSGQLNLGGGALAVYTVRLAAAKCSLGFGQALLLGILCNILVCAGVMFAAMAKTLAGKALGAYIPVSFFVFCGFEHSIANMYYIPSGLLALGRPEYQGYIGAGEAAGPGLGSFLFGNLLPVTLGNIIGGMGFALLMWLCHSEGRRKPAL